MSLPRGDYREFLALAYIFLGETPPLGIKFKAPGAMHHARFLSCAIYCLKMFIFRKQLLLSTSEKKTLKNTSIFIMKFYIKAWFSAPLAIKAPNNDLKLLQGIIGYKSIDKKTSDAARSKLANHLWYCSEELVALALFDEDVTDEVKAKMVRAMFEKDSVTEYSKRYIISKESDQKLLSMNLGDFSSKKSLTLFERFELPYDFFSLAPNEWKNNAHFQEAKLFFSDIKVVNDIAERGVALVEGFNRLLTKNEDQLQYLLQVIQNNRKKFPNCSKSSLNKHESCDDWWWK